MNKISHQKFESDKNYRRFILGTAKNNENLSIDSDYIKKSIICIQLKLSIPRFIQDQIFHTFTEKNSIQKYSK